MTSDEQGVLDKYPQAHLSGSEGRWHIWSRYREGIRGLSCLGTGKTRDDAWADAWRRIQPAKEPR